MTAASPRSCAPLWRRRPTAGRRVGGRVDPDDGPRVRRRRTDARRGHGDAAWTVAAAPRALVPSSERRPRAVSAPTAGADRSSRVPTRRSRPRARTRRRPPPGGERRPPPVRPPAPRSGGRRRRVARRDAPGGPGGGELPGPPAWYRTDPRSSAEATVALRAAGDASPGAVPYGVAVAPGDDEVTGAFGVEIRSWPPSRRPGWHEGLWVRAPAPRAVLGGPRAGSDLTRPRRSGTRAGRSSRARSRPPRARRRVRRPGGRARSRSRTRSAPRAPRRRRRPPPRRPPGA